MKRMCGSIGRKAISFQNVCSAVAAIFLALSVTLIALPDVVYWLFSLQGNDLGNFLTKRAGVLFLGLSILCFLARNSDNSEVRRIVSASVGTATCVMALLGIYELARGNAGAGILVAVFIEIVVAALFLRIWIQTAPVK